MRFFNFIRWFFNAFSAIRAKKMVDLVSLIWKILSSSNGCELTENAQRFNNSRKYLCFQRFLKQRKIFCSIKRTFSPKQTQYAPKKDSNWRLLFFVEWKIKQRQPYYRQTPRIYTLPSTEVIKFLWFIFYPF